LKKILFAVILIFFVVVVFHLTPTGAIRFYVALHGSPFAAAKVKITPGGFYERHWATTAYGWQFFVEGYRERQLGQEVHFFYLNKSFVGLWTVTSVGTGP
jgi:hypothetical protein